MRTSKWRLLHQHLTSISELNTQIEDLVLLVRQLALASQSETIYIKTGSLQPPSQETSWINHQEELT